jgi:hypothetical protein
MRADCFKCKFGRGNGQRKYTNKSKVQWTRGDDPTLRNFDTGGVNSHLGVFSNQVHDLIVEVWYLTGGNHNHQWEVREPSGSLVQ